MRTFIFKRSAGAAIAAVVLSAGMLRAQDPNTAHIPFVVNVDATVTASREIVTPIQINAVGGAMSLLSIYMGPEGHKTSIAAGAQPTSVSYPLLSSDSRGNVNLRLPEQSYQNAVVTLHSLDGRRILHKNVNAGTSVNGLTRSSAAPGLYLLNVKGNDGNTFTSRLTHRGGALNINVAFGAGVSALRRGAAEADDEWTITVSAVGYEDSTYKLKIFRGMNAQQNITLVAGEDGGSGCEVGVEGSFIDSRDNKAYRTVVMPDCKTWMAENLNFNANGSWCYNNSPDSCAKYGRLYDWATAMNISTSYNSTLWDGSDVDHQGICPAGWRLPSDADWDTLMTAVGGSSTAGTKLKSAFGWNTGSGYIPGTDDYGFSALPGGGRWSDDSFREVGYWGFWWSATEGRADFAWLRDMYYGREFVGRGSLDKAFGFSVRCLRDVRQ